MQKNIIAVFVVIILLFNATIASEDEAKKGMEQNIDSVSGVKKHLIFPDEYSELDDIHTPIYSTDEFILATLESARKKYIQALIFTENNDTNKAAIFFRKAIDELNSLVSYPDIDKNLDFVDLAGLLIEDYEDFVQNSNIIDENAPLFIIKDKIFSGIDDVFDSDESEIVTLKDKLELENITDFSLDSLTIPMTENKYVKRSIKYLSEPKLGRRVVSTWLKRSGMFFPMMRRIAKSEDMPEEIIYLSMIESGLKTSAVSRVSAVGLWQFMYRTGKEWGLNTNPNLWVDERRDPEKSTRSAFRYLKFLHEQFGDWHLAIAAYNCGEGRVRKAIKRSGLKNPSYWDIRKRLPKETRSYVPRYISIALIAMQAEAYNFNTDSLEYYDEFRFDIFPITEAVNLSVLARCANSSDSVLKMLNPELIKSTTPPNQNVYNLRIPEGSLKEFTRNFALLTEKEKQPWIEHKVKRRETLASISRKYKCQVAEILALNQLRSSKSRMRTGSLLKVPISAEKYSEINIASEIAGTYLAYDSDKDIVHRVKSGDSFYRIARKYGVSINQIKDLNGIGKNQNNLSIGQTLLIAKKKESIANNTKNNNKKKLDAPIIVRHRVARGESLQTIASLYEINIDSLKSMNNISGKYVQAGRNLRVKTNVDPKSVRRTILPGTDEITNHRVRRGETLGLIARKYGMSLRSLKRQNHLRSNRIYPGQRLKVRGGGGNPYSSSTSFASNKRSRGAKQSSGSHKVKRGESLYLIANLYGISVKKLKDLNNLKSNSIKPGQKLKINSDNQNIAKSTSSKNKQTNSDANFIFHTVKHGETLGHIAENYKCRSQQIRDWNGISGSTIRPGQKLKIRSSGKSIAQTSPKVNKSTSVHSVKSGETLSSIAANYGITENQLKSWNPKKIKGNTIYLGSKLNVRSGDYSKGGGEVKDKNVKQTVQYYKLKKGENLSIISRKYSIPLSEIKRLNPKLNERKLQIGQEIRIK
jgi:peptidoglycan lytic transglycosylase D